MSKRTSVSSVFLCLSLFSFINASDKPMKIKFSTQAITTTQAPQPIGPYSQAMLTSPQQVLLVSGQIPLHPKTGEIITDIKDATTQVMEYIKAILHAAGMDISNVVKTTIYLLDLRNFAQVNEVYASYFTGTTNFPARETVEVAALPKGAPIEISVIAAK